MRDNMLIFSKKDEDDRIQIFYLKYGYLHVILSNRFMKKFHFKW